VIYEFYSPLFFAKNPNIAVNIAVDLVKKLNKTFRDNTTVDSIKCYDLEKV
jgi:hypothetical protein